MALTPEQENEIRRLWDQGVRNKDELYAAVGVSPPMTSQNFATTAWRQDPRMPSPFATSPMFSQYMAQPAAPAAPPEQSSSGPFANFQKAATTWPEGFTDLFTFKYLTEEGKEKGGFGGAIGRQYLSQAAGALVKDLWDVTPDSLKDDAKFLGSGVMELFSTVSTATLASIAYVKENDAMYNAMLHQTSPLLSVPIIDSISDAGKPILKVLRDTFEENNKNNVPFSKNIIDSVSKANQTASGKTTTLPVPDWIAGENFPDIPLDYGRLAGELPLDIATGTWIAKGLGLPSKAVRQSQAKFADDIIPAPAPTTGLPASLQALAPGVAATRRAPRTSITPEQPQAFASDIAALQRRQNADVASATNVLTRAFNNLKYPSGKPVTLRKIASVKSERDKAQRKVNTDQKRYDDAVRAEQKKITDAQEEISNILKARQELVNNLEVRLGRPEARVNPNWTPDMPKRKIILGKASKEVRDAFEANAVLQKNAQSKLDESVARLNNQLLNKKNDKVAGTLRGNLASSKAKLKWLEDQYSDLRDSVELELRKTFSIAGTDVSGASLIPSLAARQAWKTPAKAKEIQTLQDIVDELGIARDPVREDLSQVVRIADEAKATMDPAQVERIQSGAAMLRQRIQEANAFLNESARSLLDSPLNRKKGRAPFVKTSHETSDIRQDPAAYSPNAPEGSNPPPSGRLPDGELSGTAPDGTPGNKYHSGYKDGELLENGLRNYRQKDSGILKPLRDYLDKTLYSGRVSDATGLGKWNIKFASVLESSIGFVSRKLVSRDWIDVIVSQLNGFQRNVNNLATSDTLAFLSKQFGVSAADFNGIISNLYRHIPVTADPTDPALKGLWGATDDIKRKYSIDWHDVIEGWWAHTNFTPSALASDALLQREFAEFLATKNYGKTLNRFFKNKEGKRLSFEERQKVWEEFFNETTEVGAERVGSFLDELRVYFDEMEGYMRPTSQRITGGRGRAFFPREVLTFANGRKTFFSSNSRYERFYNEAIDGVQQGVEYDNDILSIIRHHSAYAQHEQLLNQFQKIAYSPDYGFAIEVSGALGRLAKLDELSIDRSKLSPQTRKTIIQAKRILNDLEKKRDAAILKAGDDEIAIEKANQAFQKAQEKASQALKNRLTKNSGVAGEDILLPGKLFAINNSDEPITITDIHEMFGLKRSLIPTTIGRGGFSGEMLIARQKIERFERAFKSLDSIVYSPLPGEVTRRPGMVVKNLNTAVAFNRFTAFGFDPAYPFTVGLHTLVQEPRVFIRNIPHMWASFFNPNHMAYWLKNNPEYQEAFAEMARRRIPTGEVEAFQFVGKDGVFDIESYLAFKMKDNPDERFNFFRYLKQFVSQEAKYFGNKYGSKTYLGMPKAFIHRASRPWQRSYQNSIVMSRLFLMKGMEPAFTYHALDDAGNIVKKVDEIGLRTQLMNTTGAFDVSASGSTVRQRSYEPLYFALSTRLTRSVSTLVLKSEQALYLLAKQGKNPDKLKNYIAYAFSGGKKGKGPLQYLSEDAIAQGRKLTIDDAFNIADEEARQLLSLGNIGRYIVGFAGLLGSANFAIAKAEGKSDEEAFKRSLDTVNILAPTKQLFSLKIGDSYYGPGGIGRSLLSFQGAMMNSVAHMSIGDFEPISRYWIDSKNNPAISFWRNRGAPLVGWTGALIEGTFNYDTMPFESIDNLGESFAYIGKSYAPLVGQQLADEGWSHRIPIEWFGIRASEVSMSDVTVIVAREILGMDVNQVRDIEESWIKNEVLYPQIEDQFGYTFRESNGPIGKFMKRKDELDEELFLAITRDYQSGRMSARQLVNSYKSKRKERNAKLSELAKNIDFGEPRKNQSIAKAIEAYNAVYESEEYLNAVTSEEYDVIEKQRQALLLTFTPEQQAAALRTGSGIPLQILYLLSPIEQQTYWDRFNARVAWINENAITPDAARVLKNRLEYEMFPSILAPRGVEE